VAPTILEARDLSKSFSGAALFSGLSFSRGRGLLAVTGPNGSGKTTLLKILASLLAPSSGTVRVRREGRDLSGDDRRCAVGWAGPDLAFYEDSTAEENLRFFRRAAGVAADPADLPERLEGVGLREATRRPLREFSSGMKQRLRVAFALLLDPPILLLDEPMAGLDAEGKKVVEGIVSARRQGGLVVFASNDPREFVAPDDSIELGRRG